jgi:hypothetical protein
MDKTQEEGSGVDFGGLVRTTSNNLRNLIRDFELEPEHLLVLRV